MTKSLDQLRRDAKAFRKAYEAGELRARQRIANYPPRPETTVLKHSDYLHVIARENSFPSWPALKFAADLLGMDKATKRQRLKLALAQGHFTAVDQLLADAPELSQDMLDIANALLEAGADVDLGAPVYHGNDYKLSPLYFAIGHSDNMILGQWLLKNGANPNDGESLYHSTELGHHKGLQLLLDHGAEGP